MHIEQLTYITFWQYCYKAYIKMLWRDI